MAKWEPFIRRVNLPVIMLKVTWKTLTQYGTDTFNTYYYIGRLPYKYHEQLCERFEKVFVGLHQKKFKEQSVIRIDIVVFTLFTGITIKK